MKLVYFCNLFILCFIIQPSNSLKPNLNICRSYSLPPNHFYKKMLLIIIIIKLMHIFI